MLFDVPQATSEVDTAKEKQKYVWELEVRLRPNCSAHAAAETTYRFRRTVQHGVAVVHA